MKGRAREGRKESWAKEKADVKEENEGLYGRHGERREEGEED